MRVLERAFCIAAGLTLSIIVFGQATTAQTAHAEKKATGAELARLQDLYLKQIDSKQWSAALQTVDKLVDCQLCRNLGHLRVFALSGDVKNYSETGRKVLASDNDPIALNEVAWHIVDPTEVTLKPRDLELAKTAAERAVELTKHKDSEMLDTLAWTYHWMGENAKAIEMEREALARNTNANNREVFRRTLHANFTETYN